MSYSRASTAIQLAPRASIQFLAFGEDDMNHAPGKSGTGSDRPALSRRAALVLLTGGFLSISLPPPPRQMRLTDDIVIVDGWMLRTGDLEGMPGVAY
jgi:hypothetical protein